MTSHRRRWPLRLARSIAGMALLVEAALRWGVGLGDPVIAIPDPEIEYRLKPSASYARFGNRIEINSLGTRGPEISAQVAPSERRILLIGDSIVYGTEHLDQDETVGSRLRDLLRAAPELGRCEPEVIAMAASSWGPVNAAAFLDRFGTIGASAAAVIVSAHDLYDLPEAPPQLLTYRLEPSWSAIGDAAAEVMRRIRPGRPTAEETRSLEHRARISLEALSRMTAQLRAASMTPLLVYHPTRRERGGFEARERAVFRDWAIARGVTMIDLGREIEDEDGYRDEIHPDPIGAKRIAAVLARRLIDRIPACVP